MRLNPSPIPILLTLWKFLKKAKKEQEFPVETKSASNELVIIPLKYKGTPSLRKIEGLYLDNQPHKSPPIMD